MSLSVAQQIETLIRRDPAGRGLAGNDRGLPLLCAGHLEQAANDLVASARRVALITGFFVPDADPPAAETDGPPGAVVLARALAKLGAEVVLVTDSFCAGALRAACEAGGVDSANVDSAPREPRGWMNSFFADGAGRGCTHLVAIERVGASHDEGSIARQAAGDDALNQRFLHAVPAEDRDRCHNMRGDVIDEYLAPLHRFFEIGPRCIAGLKTIGIGDGGNEIGMGSIPWNDLVLRLPTPRAARMFCRIATDWTIIAGTSNWGAFGLAAALLARAGKTDALAPLDERYHIEMLEAMVSRGPAVDGITRQRAPSIDGLPFETYIQTWLDIRRLLGIVG